MRLKEAATWALAAAATIAVTGGLISCKTGPLTACKAVTVTGDETFYMPVLALVYAVYRGATGVVLVSSLLAASSATVFLKALIGSPRPPPEEWLVEASGPGFPSGHATLSAAFWTAAYGLSRDPRILLLGVLHASAVSYSRVALGVHYPVDVIGGLLVGSSIAALVYAFINSRGLFPGVPLVLVASLLLSVIASLLDPSYQSSLKLSGLTLGSLAGYTMVIARYPDSLGAGGLSHRAIAGLIASAAHVAPLLAGDLGAPAAIPVFALYALAVALSRPIALLLAPGRTGESRLG